MYKHIKNHKTQFKKHQLSMIVGQHMAGDKSFVKTLYISFHASVQPYINQGNT